MGATLIKYSPAYSILLEELANIPGCIVKSIEPHFPPGVWELIFRNCSVTELKEIRLVCRRWNEIVMGCPSLWCRFVARFRRNNRGRRTTYLPPVKNASVNLVEEFNTFNSWWPEFGPYLENLCLDRCDMTAGELFFLLRHCPGLKCLRLLCVEFVQFENVDNDFMPESLEEFIYHVYGSPVVIEEFGPIFPRLKRFTLNAISFFSQKDLKESAIVNSRVSKFIQTVQGTLEILELPQNVKISFSEMNQLQLKRARFVINCDSPHWDMELWTTFCQRQSKMQHFDTYGANITNEILSVAVRNMPQLKSFSSNLNDTGVPTFLNNLSSSVEKVRLEADVVPLDFRVQVSTSLRELKLVYADIQHGIDCLMTSTHIEKLTLYFCDLRRCPVPSEVKNVSVIKNLVLTNSRMKPEMLEFVLNHHPQLEEVAIQCSLELRTDTLLNLLWRSPELQQVSLENCRGVAETSGEEIMKSYFEKYDLDKGSRTVRFSIQKEFSSY